MPRSRQAVKATQTRYEQNLTLKGIKRISLRLSPEANAALKPLAKRYGSKVKAIEEAIQRLAEAQVDAEPAHEPNGDGNSLRP